MAKSIEMGPARVKRTVLVVDDEQVNREILNLCLQERYEVLQAADGSEAMELLCANPDGISLVLLDLMMPGVNGLDLLRLRRENSLLQRIPVIVMTSDQSAEVECLKLGALDFISKPYPQRSVVLARVERIIELSEDQQLIQSTERDSLTGLYNRDYFYRYAQQFDRRHRWAEMDAIVIDINHFRMVNERYGKACGDDILRLISQRLRAFLEGSEGMVCRRGADTFLVYCPHGCDYQAMLEAASVSFTPPGSSGGIKVRLRMGVYPCADKDIDIERRFDRAKLAADTLRNNYAQSISLYDSALHDTELFAEQLLEDFPAALEQGQFVVYYQPKFDVRPHTPVLASAEALIRWNHPRLGLMGPGAFIPLFESNGLIPLLDRYVWQAVARQIRTWKQELGVAVPVSVNVSRVDMYDPHLVETFQQLVEQHHLSPTEFLLEITESAYTHDTDQIIGIVSQLRSLGFRVEMDDFGTGYSSLNMLSSLPIDALKLDMMFIRSAFQGAHDLRLLELVIDIARYLGVPTVAEGVETSEQLHALKALGCDFVQGFYFSRPLPPEDFETFLLQRKDQLSASRPMSAPAADTASGAEITQALSKGFESVYYVDADSGHYVEFSSSGRYSELKIENSGVNFFEDSQRNLKRVVYSEDQHLVASAMDRDLLLSYLSQQQSFTLRYRLMIDSQPTWYTMRICKAAGKGPAHLLIGISSDEPTLRPEDSPLSAQLNSISQSLSSDFVGIYYVSLIDDTYLSFTTPSVYARLPLHVTGEHFFQESRSNCQAVVYFEDRPKVEAVLDKERLLRRLEDTPAVIVDYRLMIEGQPVYYRMKVTMDDQRRDHVVYGVCDISTQRQQEQEYDAAHKNSITYSLIAQALSQDYYCIYYINLETGHFIRFNNTGPSHRLIPELTGDDFFQTARKLILSDTAPEDRDMMLSMARREVLSAQTENGKALSLSFCAMLDAQPTHISLKALRLANDNAHLVIGLRDIEAQAQWQQEYEATKAERATYSRIARALAQDYFSIYYVNVETDDYVEYAPRGRFQDLHVERRGTGLFQTAQDRIPETVYSEDQTKAAESWKKETILLALADADSFSTSYRILVNHAPVYVSMKAVRMQEGDEHHIIISVSNIDNQVKRDQAFAAAQEMAMRDDLTGVKNKRSYSLKEQSLNRMISDGVPQRFAVLVSDVNDLKLVNDTEGHSAGDEYIRRACAMLCDIFAHSPVYRIGGDEFVVLLSGSDYTHRRRLMSRLAAQTRRKPSRSGLPLLSCGLAEYVPGQDTALAQVFARADAAMYQQKADWKASRKQ